MADAWRGGVAIGLTLLLVGATAARAQLEGYDQPPTVPAVVADPPPLIDGELNDGCWQQAPRLEGFFFSVENRPGTEPTEAWVCVDSTTLYAAIYAHDSRPETILSQQTQRSAGLERDDYVSLHLDSTLRQVEHYTFRVSPRGTQDDSIPNSGSGNIAWRGDWRAAGRRVPDGYTVEMAIPFSILRYSRGQTRLAFGFGRNLEREEEGSIWPPMRDRFEERFLAVLGPLELPEPRNPPAILPYAIARADSDGFTIQSGLDIKQTFVSGVTGLFTANPDFLNIEDVVETIAFSDTPRFLGETRPFFREGSGFFPSSQAIHTRLIPDVNVGVKSFGQTGHHEFGVLGTLSDHGRVDSAFDYTYRFTPYLSLGTGLVYAEDPANLVTTSHFDSYHLFGKRSLSYGGDFRHSTTRGPGGEGNAWNVYTNWGGGDGGLNANFSYSLTDPEYHPNIGFVAEHDRRGWSAGISSGKRRQGQTIQNYSWYANHGEAKHQDGSLLQNSWGAGGNLRFDNGTSFNLGLFTQRRPPNHDGTISGSFSWGLESLHDEGALSATWGRRGGADYLFCKLEQGWAPLEALRFNGWAEYTFQDFDDPAKPTVTRTQAVVSSTYELDAWSSVSARFIERDGNLNLFLTYRHAPTSGRTLSLLFGDPNSLRTQVRFQVKVTWPL